MAVTGFQSASQPDRSATSQNNQLPSTTPSANDELVIAYLATTDTGAGGNNVPTGYTAVTGGLKLATANSYGGGLCYLIQTTAAATAPLFNANDANRITGLNSFFLSPIVPLTASASDSFAFSDAIAVFAECFLTLSDVLAFDDFVVATNDPYAIISDSFTFSDEVNGFAGAFATLTDSLTFLDTVIDILNFAISVSDDFTFDDNLLPYSLGILFHLSDSLSFGDAAHGNPVFSKIVQDNFTITDALVAKMFVNSILHEAIAFADSNKIDLKDLVSTSDAMVFADAVQFAILAQIERSAGDSFAFSDEVVTLVPGPSDDYLRRYLNDKIR